MNPNNRRVTVILRFPHNSARNPEGLACLCSEWGVEVFLYALNKDQLFPMVCEAKIETAAKLQTSLGRVMEQEQQKSSKLVRFRVPGPIGSAPGTGCTGLTSTLHALWAQFCDAVRLK